AKRGRASALPRQDSAARGSSRPALEHDSERDRNEFHGAAVIALNAILTRSDEGMEHGQRQVDASAGVPAELVLGRALEASGLHGRQVHTSAADQVQRNSSAREVPDQVTRGAQDVELGAVGNLRAESVVRTIDA